MERFGKICVGVIALWLLTISFSRIQLMVAPELLMTFYKYSSFGLGIVVGLWLREKRRPKHDHVRRDLERHAG